MDGPTVTDEEWLARHAASIGLDGYRSDDRGGGRQQTQIDMVIEVQAARAHVRAELVKVLRRAGGEHSAEIEALLAADYRVTQELRSVLDQDLGTDWADRHD